MYSVIRFSGETATVEFLGKAINSIIPGMYSGLDHVDSRCSLELSKNSLPMEHIQEVCNIIRKLSDSIVQARSLGVAVVVDFAVGPDDYWQRWMTQLAFGTELLRELADLSVDMVITVYGNGPASANVVEQD